MFNRRELAVTHSIEEEARIRGLLRDNGIPATSDYPDRFSARPDRSAVPCAREQLTCVFYVKKKDYGRAVQILHSGK